ncbi:hypothetical protein [Williamsia sterculiae]|uniref:Excreted virulence factor EspC, type VII ESX diderm n=1 Tax=Williamsia sterculiae TaxID=1344003 RepID=A0A1N7HAX7_9NOCA|nr:hypothetical protein [Williamsia sterculiae]SIS22016.1 hypothetical protein SAMN05445060_3868 [Williamsia sterculiae]
MDVDVQPAVLKQAADGINGVIGGLSGAPVIGSYTGQTGRGFSELQLTGEQMSRPNAKAAMDDFCQRWEWGMRALVRAANDIGHALHLGAGMYETQDKYASDTFKDFANDLVGDPSLQKESVTDDAGNIITRGTDDMSAGQLLNHNVDKLTHPDISPESVLAVRGDIENSLTSMGDSLQKGYETSLGGQAINTVAAASK